MVMPKYQYLPLLQDPQHLIRLMLLHPGHSDSLLSCSFISTALEHPGLKPVSYDALSYVWGSPDAERSVINVDCDQGTKAIYILPNLEAALYRFRHPTEYIRIWVDALCIKQDDPVEKNHQVPMMGKIYQNARRVMIWLGNEADDSDIAMDFIAQVTDLSKFDQIIKDRNSTRQWYALSRLMNRSWFSRRWVVQEFAFAREAFLCCGEKQVSWESFADSATLFGKGQKDIANLFWISSEYAHDAEILGEIEALGALRLINATTRLFRHSNDGGILEGLASLESLVTSLECFQTQDPRDSIYAVMRLAEQVDNSSSNTRPNSGSWLPGPFYPVLTVNYSLPFDEIARAFVAFCIRSSNSLDIICRPWAPVPSYYFPNGSSETAQRLPSWACTLDDSVFDIRGGGHHVRRRGNSFVGSPGRPIYQASKWFQTIPVDDQFHWDSSDPHLELAQFPVDATWSEKAPRMQVKGVQIGTIQFLGERAMEGAIPSGWFFMAHWAQRRHPVPEAFFRTLIADRGLNGENPPTWYKRAFEHALLNSRAGDVTLQRMINQSKSTVIAEVLSRIQSVIWNRRLAITDRGAVGLVPANAQLGDTIMVLYGASVPVILRRLHSSFFLVGESYIHGSMDGLKSIFPSESRHDNGEIPIMPRAQVVTIR